MAYGNYSPPKKSNTGLIVGLVIGAILLCCIGPVALVGGLGFFAFSKSKDMLVCGMAYNDMWTAVEDYSRDHDGKLPHAKTWMDDLRPYYKKVVDAKPKDNGQKFIGQMSPDGVFGCTSDGRATGMAFNKALDGKSMSGIKDRYATIILFESPTPPTSNLSEKYEPQSLAGSPTIMNKPRGWFTLNAEGQALAGRMKFQQGFNGSPQVITATTTGG